MIKYRPSILHAYGWVPGLIWRNLKGTVFRDGACRARATQTNRAHRGAPTRFRCSRAPRAVRDGSLSLPPARAASRAPLRARGREAPEGLPSSPSRLRAPPPAGAAYLHVQVLAMVLWATFIGTTGLGVRAPALRGPALPVRAHTLPAT